MVVTAMDDLYGHLHRWIPGSNHGGDICLCDGIVLAETAAAAVDGNIIIIIDHDTATSHHHHQYEVTDRWANCDAVHAVHYFLMQYIHIVSIRMYQWLYLSDPYVGKFRYGTKYGYDLCHIASSHIPRASHANHHL